MPNNQNKTVRLLWISIAGKREPKKLLKPKPNGASADPLAISCNIVHGAAICWGGVRLLGAAAHPGHSRGRGRGAGGCRPAAPGPTWRGWPGCRGWGGRPRSLGGGGPSLGHVLVTETLRPRTGGRGDATGPTTGHRRLGAGHEDRAAEVTCFLHFLAIVVVVVVYLPYYHLHIHCQCQTSAIFGVNFFWPRVDID